MAGRMVIGVDNLQLLQDGAIKIDGGWAEVMDADLPPTLRLTILRRLSFLADDTLQVLRLATILGTGVADSPRCQIAWRPGA